MNHLIEHIFESKVANFDELCLAVFKFQSTENPVYHTYLELINRNDKNRISGIHEIPFLPIDFFKTKEVVSFTGLPEKKFYSSASGKKGQSMHLVFDIKLYEKSFKIGFENYFGNLKKVCILGLLPSYLEREGSSLIYMVQKLMQESEHPLNGFFLYEHEALMDRIIQLEKKGQPYFIFGVSFALLDFAQKHPKTLHHGIVIETGGMKGRKKEITRNELYDELSGAFQTEKIFSEYGMTELLSQAYADRRGLYTCQPWMKAICVDPNDPFTQLAPGKSGLLCFIDLANIYSCAFIQTSDLGKVYDDGKFEVLGRMDQSDLRGCSLLIS